MARGMWIPQDTVVRHRCRPPLLLPWRRTGLVWACGCGRTWRITLVDSWTDCWREWVAE